jgi:uncharacterized protein (DUF433 family)
VGAVLVDGVDQDVPGAEPLAAPRRAQATASRAVATRAPSIITSYPLGRPEVGGTRRKVVIDPYRAFGQPIFEGSRARVRDIANTLAAGEDPQVVAYEHGVGIEEVRTPPASSWVPPPEFYLDENVVTRSVRPNRIDQVSRED